MKFGKNAVITALLTVGAGLMTISASCSIGEFEGKSPHQNRNQQATPHNTYQNVEVMNKMSLKEHVGMYWKFFFEKGEKVPSEPLPQEKLDPADLSSDIQNGLKASWLGHSSIYMNIDGVSVLTDPVFERKISLVGPSRFNKESVLDIDDVRSVDVVIISHDHYDHLNKASIRKLIDITGYFIVPVRVGSHLRKWGVPAKKIVELDWWEEFTLEKGVTIVATPSQHFSGRGLFDRNKTLWASWVIASDKHRVFFSGDSGYFGGFKDIGDQYGPFDVTFLECGAYNDGWSKIHMFPEQTVQAFLDLKGKILQPIHWATFNLALHPWYEPVERLTKRARQAEVDVSTPVMGAVVDYDKPAKAEGWWQAVAERGKKRSVRELAAVNQ